MIVDVNVILLVEKKKKNKNKKKGKLAITVNKEITKVSLAQEGKLGEVLEPQAF
jgi:hypothetical protein